MFFLGKIFIILFTLLSLFRYASGIELKEAQAKPLNNSGNKIVAKSFGIYQIAWNPVQFKRELIEKLSILENHPSVVMFYRDLSNNRGFPLPYIKIIDSIGAIPMISWELWIWGKGKGIDYLSDILAGKYDSYFKHWAKDCGKWGKNVFIRPGFEMNGNWFPWCGNPKKFKSVWKHIYQLFEAEKCKNTLWVWSPNTKSFPANEWNRFENYYPGSEFVDWVGLDGYNWGDKSLQRPYSKWETFNDIFETPLNKMEKLAPDKPIMISEIGSAEGKFNKKAKWIEDAFHKLCNFPKLRMLIWFNYDKRTEGEPDWRINSSIESLNMFNKFITQFNGLELKNSF